MEKPTQAQEVAGRISGAVAGEDLHQAYQVPIISSQLLHLHYSPFASCFPPPTSKTFLEKHKNICLFIWLLFIRLFFCFLFACVLDCLLCHDVSRKYQVV
jgi:hypothetical protein